MINRIGAPVENYHGGPAVWKLENKYYMGVENYNGWDHKGTAGACEISEEFYNAWVKEFQEK